MYDIVAVGELLIDFTPSGTDAGGAALFGRNPGGAPANVLAAAARLGGRTAFIGKVGNDAFGSFLKGTLDGIGVDTRGLAVDEAIPTTLAFVQLDDKGDRSFSFYRKPGADIMLSEADLDRDLLKEAQIIHFGSVSLTDEPSRGATLAAVRAAREGGALVSYDPNYRAPLWGSQEEAVGEMKRALSLADVVKVSEEELPLLTGETDLQRGADRIREQGVALVLVTLGPKGAYYRTGSCSGILATYDVATVDTTGAGDAFLGAVLWQLRGKSREDLEKLDNNALSAIVDFANAAGSLATIKRGAIPSMPSAEEIEECRLKVSRLE